MQNFAFDANGKLSLELYSLPANLEPLRGIQINRLWLIGLPANPDLSALHELPLEYLNIRNTEQLDLKPLQGVPLTECVLESADPTDLAAFAGMRSLKHLIVHGMGRVTTLGPLKGVPLETVHLSGPSQIKNLSGLEGMPLKRLHITGIFGALTDLSALEDLPIEELTFLNFPTGFASLPALF